MNHSVPLNDFILLKKKKAENKLCSLQPKCLETFYGRGRH